MLCELWSEKFEWFGPSPIEPFNLGNDPLIRPDLPDPGTFALLGAGAFLSGSGAIVLFAIAMLIEVLGLK